MLYLRINQLLEDNGITWQQLAEKAGIPEETVRNIYYGKVKDPKASTMLALSRALKISVNRIMGERLYAEDEETLINYYRKCGNHGKSLMMLTAEYEATSALSERNRKGRHRVPCLIPIGEIGDGMKYSTCETIEAETDEERAYLAVLVPNNYWAPAYCKNDRLLLEKKFPKTGEYGLFTIDEKVYFRRYMETEEGFILQCPNDRNEDICLHRMDGVCCVGTCIGIIRSE